MQPKVIYDGQCDFCIACVAWIQNRIEIEAFANQDIEPADFGVTREQCEKSVVVIADSTYFGADAVAFLLKHSGNSLFSRIIKLSGPLGKVGYRYVANHRDGALVRILHWIIKKST